VQFAATAEGGAREAVGLAAAVVVLLLTFGSVVAMVLPLTTALIGLGVALAAVPLLSVFIDVPIFGPSLAIMIGLGVGIDYALFILTRFRACLHEGAPSEDACATALTTAGRAVLFAGVTVCISMLGLFIMGISFVNGMAVSAILAVLLTMVASVTLLPALLGFAGPAVDRFAIPRLGTRAQDGSGLELVPVEPVRATPPVAHGPGCTRRTVGPGLAGPVHATRVRRRELQSQGQHNP